MPWSIPPALLSDVLQFSVVISTDQQDYNLYTVVGSPTGPAIVDLEINSNADVNTMTLGNFAVGTIINIDIIGNARILGRGGSGGDGGSTSLFGINEKAGADGAPGGAGGAALTIPTAITVNLDMDAGFIYGGGGGGGGGGASGGTIGNPNHAGGGGGGGGQGWDTNPGGAGGTDLGSATQRPGTAGTTGNISGPGNKGLGGNTGLGTPDGDGGDGAAWGLAGDVGENQWLYNALGGPQLDNVGGAGGTAGNSISGPTATVVFTGLLSEAQLVTAGQLRGTNDAL